MAATRKKTAKKKGAKKKATKRSPSKKRATAGATSKKKATRKKRTSKRKSTAGSEQPTSIGLADRRGLEYLRSKLQRRFRTAR